MCGFVAFLGLGRAASARSEAWMRRLTDSIAHRGPDDAGTAIEGPALLGFRRLSIIDRSSASHQPMRASDGRHAIVFNGEIYNYVELRDELAALGHRFRTTGDTEVLLTAYRQWGEQAVERLRGMFAFCIVDHDRRQIVIARDRMGIKPLYAARTIDGVLFASELKAIRRAGIGTHAPNMSRFARFLAAGRTEELGDGSETFLDGVEQVQAGEQWVLGFDGDERRRRYWSPLALPDRPLSGVEELRAAFDDAIRVHLRADVPVGIMLSGGMDSVSIACRWTALAHGGRAEPGRVQAFCYVSAEYDEKAQLEDTLARTGITPNYLHDGDAQALAALLPHAVWHHDEPFQSPTVLVGYGLYALAASRGIKVVLSGQGADEALGGYPAFNQNLLLSLLMQGRLVELMRQASTLHRLGAPSVEQQLLRTVLMLRSRVLGRVGYYTAGVSRRRAYAEPGYALLGDEMRDHLVRSHRDVVERPLGSALRMALADGTLPHYLRVEDRNSMAHGVEARVPFLDHPFVELAMRLPDDLRLWDGWNKRALREAMRGLIPDSVVTRRQKFGFPTSARGWLAGEWFPRLQAMLLDGELVARGWVRRDVLARYLEEHRRLEADHTSVLFAAKQVETWLKLDRAGWERPDPIVDHARADSGYAMA